MPKVEATLEGETLHVKMTTYFISILYLLFSKPQIVALLGDNFACFVNIIFTTLIFLPFRKSIFVFTFLLYTRSNGLHYLFKLDVAEKEAALLRCHIFISIRVTVPTNFEHRTWGYHSTYCIDL